MVSFWGMALAMFIVGITDGAGMVIWGNLLQRRVPPQMLGRVSSLDFFVSLAFMPGSMALGARLPKSCRCGSSSWWPEGVCPVVAVAAMMVARMRDDELAHPLDHGQVDSQMDGLAADDGEVDGRRG